MLRPYFSELAWMNERAFVMVAHLRALAPVFGFTAPALPQKFSIKDGERISGLERVLNHDLKALEQYVATKIPLQTRRYLLYGLGSEDVNSIAFGRLVVRSREQVILPNIFTLLDDIAETVKREQLTFMIARTHALPAGVSTLGKELANPLFRLCDEISHFKTIPFQAKLSGEVGTFHSISYGAHAQNWLKFSDKFIRAQGLEPQHGSTQIVPYDSLIRYLQSLSRINTILIDLCKNIWLYILLGYVRIVKKEKEVGSSGMPHKVNPIYFEGAEGGLGMANGIIETLARTLMVNRLQRDFSDSTVRRNVPLVLAYSLLSYQSMHEAFQRIQIDRKAISLDLENHAEVWIEPIKIVLIESGMVDAFDVLKKKTRGRSFTRTELGRLIDSLPISVSIKRKLTELPMTVNPYLTRITAEALSKVRKVKKL